MALKGWGNSFYTTQGPQGKGMTKAESAYPQNSSNPDENRLHEFSADMFEISVGAHACAMNSRLKAAPTFTIPEREFLRCSAVRTSPQEVTVVLAVNVSMTDQETAAFKGAGILLLFLEQRGEHSVFGWSVVHRLRDGRHSHLFS
jgi:hypothetical protein